MAEVQVDCVQVSMQHHEEHCMPSPRIMCQELCAEGCLQLMGQAP